MSLVVLLLLSVIMPFFAVPMIGAGMYFGFWSPEVAWALGTVALSLRHGRLFAPLTTLVVSAIFAAVLVVAGICLAHFYYSVLDDGGRVLLGLFLWMGFFGWLFVAFRHPDLLTELRLPRPAEVPPRVRSLTLAFLIMPMFRGDPPGNDPHVPIKQALTKAKWEPLGPITNVDRPKKGWAALIRETRHIVLAKKGSEPSEVLLVRVRHGYAARPTSVSAIHNLSRTSAVEESSLTVNGLSVAWLVGTAPFAHHVELLDLSGEVRESGPGWSEVDDVQRQITNIQETGQARGIKRDMVFLSDEAIAEFSLKDRQLSVKSDTNSAVWKVGSALSDDLAAAGFVVSRVPPPRPGTIATWAVDRLRAVPWIGSNGIQWIKAVVFQAVQRAEDLKEELSTTDPQETVAEEIGDVWQRLPVLESSSIEGWPPEPIPPKLKDSLAGEGSWIDMSHEAAFSSLESRAMLFTFVRVDPKRAYNQVSIALWDPRRIEMNIVAGTEEPRSTLGQRGTGLIPRDPATLERLVAAFNGAFQAVHGEFGMMENRVVQLPPKPFAATVSTHEDGSVKLGTWPADPTPIPSDMVGLRQNMTPLVAEGRINPYKRHWWGGVPEGWHDDTRTVRSGFCRTKEGFLAYFYSPGIDPQQLAEAMLMARCDYGVHLDMNGGHAGFELYRVGKQTDLPDPGRPLDAMWEATDAVPDAPGYRFNARLMVRKMPLMNFPRYIQPTPRDFFYLTRRVLLPGANLASVGALSASPWEPLAAKENVFPHFAVAAKLTSDEKSLVLVKVDAKQLVPGPPDDKVTLAFSSTRAEEGSVALYYVNDRFLIAKTRPENAVLVTSGNEETGSQGLCVDKDGFLILVTASAKSRPLLPEALGSLGCVRSFFKKEALALSFEKQKEKENAVHFGRSKSLLAAPLFPKTPIVDPAVWGLPQARRAALVK